MTVNLGTASIAIVAETAGLAAGIDKAKLLVAGLGAGALDAAANVLKLGGAFEQANTLLVTSAGESQKNIAMVGAGILKMSVDTATPIKDLQTAMFTLESSGAHGKAGLAELQAAAEGARVENADLTGVVQALATTMHDWQEPATQAIDVMNSFRAAASLGNMRMDDFTGAMKNVGPVASLLKIPLTDIEAALSTMSLEGDKGAAAGTHLAQSLMNMLNPSSKAKGVLQEIGLTAQQVNDDLKKSLPDTLAMITEDIGAKFPAGSALYNQAMANMFGGTRGLKSILELTGGNLQTFERDAAAIAPTMKDNATAVDGWAQVQKNFNFHVDQARQALNVMGTMIGTDLMPIASAFIQNVVVPAEQHFQDWATNTTGLRDAFQTVVDVMSTVITDTAGLITWFTQGGVQTNLLKDALLDTGIALGTIKIVEFAQSIREFTTVTIPDTLGKFGLWTAATATQSTTEDAQTVATKALTTALQDLSTQIQGVTTQLGLLAGQEATTTGTTDTLTASTDALATSTEAAGTAATDAAPIVAAGFGSMLGPIAAVTIAAGLAYQAISAVPPMPTTTTVTTNTGPDGSPVTTTVSNPGNIGAIKEGGIDTIMDTQTAAQKLAAIQADANAKKIAAEKATEQTMITDYNNYLATMQANQEKSDWLRRQNGLKAQYATESDARAYQDQMAEYAYTKTQSYVRDQDASYTLVTQYQNNQLRQMVQNVSTYYDQMVELAYSKTQAYVRDTYESDTKLMQYYNQLATVGSTTASSGSVPSSGGIGKHASGGTIAPGERGIVGDPGPYAEMIEGGTQGVSVLPAGPTAALRQQLVYGQQYPAASGGAGSYGGARSLQQELHLHLEIGGHAVAHAITRDSFAIDELAHGIVKHMKLKTGVRY